MFIRTATAADLPPIVDIYNYEVVHTTASFDMQPKTVEERQEWFNQHNQHNHPLIVADEVGEVVGFACWSPYREREAYAATVELSIYVSHLHRRRGIATRLMEEILAMARQDPRTHTVISVITHGNAASIALHERFGFAYCGTLWDAGRKFGQWLGIDNYQLMV